MPVKKVNPAKSEAKTVGSTAGVDLAAALAAVANALGVGVTAGSAAGLTATDTQHKTDVNVPELMTGLNGLAQRRALAQETVSDSFSNQIIQNAITQANNIVTMANESANMISKQAIRHTDIAIDREWNIDEQSVAVAALYARLIERLNNPTPPAE